MGGTQKKGYFEGFMGQVCEHKVIICLGCGGTFPKRPDATLSLERAELPPEPPEDCDDDMLKSWMKLAIRDIIRYLLSKEKTHG